MEGAGSLKRVYDDDSQEQGGQRSAGREGFRVVVVRVELNGKGTHQTKTISYCQPPSKKERCRNKLTLNILHLSTSHRARSSSFISPSGWETRGSESWSPKTSFVYTY
ncbi:hypothetical protein PSTG_05724 [Puccinia striiformis f. sp. tritici PST-78]|uniref:Uncharacterized protein n=1 Tax=Puccinia striiformis f. sp. tritici PST-78 TaxID=1165861 RepID=A0A0L0VQ23_9BASI|nr:hypothetical protein PSTG_05724 [Puccinia striiformis f. sp. tritici PST-78]